MSGVIELTKALLQEVWMFCCFCLFILFYTPMVLFSGTRIPAGCFPLWARVLSLLFPLTYCLDILRLVLHITGDGTGVEMDMLRLGICLVIMVGITKILLARAEANNRKNGELQFY